MSTGINIANYEIFLLRFIDGDLSAAEEAGLQHFLEQHPLIREELQLLQGTVLTPDPGVMFENKGVLYRGTPGLHADNQTDFLLRYMDDELSAPERTATEAYLAQNPAARAELALLQQTRLQPDRNLVFLHKASLYRHRHRMRPVYWWSAGAAAVIAGWIVFTTPFLNRNSTVEMSAVTIVSQRPQVKGGTVFPPSSSKERNNPGADDVAADQHQGAAAIIAGTTPATRNTTPAMKAPVATGLPVVTDAPHTHTAAPVVVAVTDHEPVVAPDNSNNNIMPGNNAPVTAQTNSTIASYTNTANNVSASGTAPAPVTPSGQDAAPAQPPVMMAMASSKEESAVPAGIHGELIASVVSTGDSKLLDKVTNVARFFAKKKANNK